MSNQKYNANSRPATEAEIVPPFPQVEVWVNGTSGYLVPYFEAQKYFEEEKRFYKVAINKGRQIILNEPIEVVQ